MDKYFNDRKGIILATVTEATASMKSSENAYSHEVVTRPNFVINFEEEFIVVNKDTVEKDYFDGNKVFLGFSFDKRTDLDNLMIQFGLVPTADIQADMEKLIEKLTPGTTVVLFTNDNGDWRNYVAPYKTKGLMWGVGLPMLDYLKNHIDLSDKTDVKSIKTKACEVYAAFVRRALAEVK